MASIKGFAGVLVEHNGITYRVEVRVTPRWESRAATDSEKQKAADMIAVESAAAVRKMASEHNNLKPW